MRKEILEQGIVERDCRKPVWKQPRGNYGSNFWQMYSRKLDRDVHFYSSLERDHGVIVEADPTVAWFCEQPLRIDDLASVRRLRGHGVVYSGPSPGPSWVTSDTNAENRRDPSQKRTPWKIADSGLPKLSQWNRTNFLKLGVPEQAAGATLSSVLRKSRG